MAAWRPKSSKISTKTHAVVVDELGNVTTTGGRIILSEINTNKLVNVPLNEYIMETFHLSVEDTTTTDDGGEATEDTMPKKEELQADPECNEKLLWSSKNTLFLIETVKTYDEEFSKGMKKRVWEKVANECKLLNPKLTPEKCESKWKTLNRTYRSIKAANNTSGQKVRHWEFFDAMDDILFKKPEINPRATCSSLAGLKVNADNVEVLEAEVDNQAGPSRQTNRTNDEPPVSSFAKKRRIRESQTDKRHQEKMQRLDKFNNLFEKFIDKLP